MTIPTLTPRTAREQRAFRAWLDAMARPGTVAAVAPHPQGGPFAGAVALLEAVLDHEVTLAVALGEDGLTPALAETLLRLTGVRPAPVERASFVVATAASAPSLLPRLVTGTPEYPDHSASLVVLVDAIGGESDVPLRLTGPGIDGTNVVGIRSLGGAFVRALAEANSELPMGIDVTCVSPDGRFTCLSRYTSIALSE